MKKTMIEILVHNLLSCELGLGKLISHSECWPILQVTGGIHIDSDDPHTSMCLSVFHLDVNLA